MTIVNFTPLPAFIGGALIGVASAMLMIFFGRIAGITGLMRRVMPPYAGARPLDAAAFLVGLIVAPLLYRAATGADAVQTVPEGTALLMVAGLLVGLGSGLANGCTSGHSVCGLSRLSPRSIAATSTFIATAMITVYVTRHVLGGGA